MANEAKTGGEEAKPLADEKTKDKVKSATDSVRATAEEGGQAARDALGSAASAAREQAEEGREAIEENANYLADSARKTAERQAEQRKKQATDYAQTTADDLRTAQDDVSNEWIAAALGQGARGVENFADSIRGKSVREIAGQTRNFARDHPTAFLTGCFAAGVALNRALRVTKHQSSYTDSRGEFFSDRPKADEGRENQAPAYGSYGAGPATGSAPSSETFGQS